MERISSRACSIEENDDFLSPMFWTDLCHLVPVRETELAIGPSFRTERKSFLSLLVDFHKVFTALPEQPIDRLISIFSGPIPRLTPLVVDRGPEQAKLVNWAFHEPRGMRFEICHDALP